MDHSAFFFKPINQSGLGNSTARASLPGKKLFNNATLAENRLNSVIHSTASAQPGKVSKRKVITPAMMQVRKKQTPKFTSSPLPTNILIQIFFKVLQLG
jgi:hypothetical protein